MTKKIQHTAVCIVGIAYSDAKRSKTENPPPLQIKKQKEKIKRCTKLGLWMIECQCAHAEGEVDPADTTNRIKTHA